MTPDEYNRGREIGALHADVKTIKSDVESLKTQVGKLNAWRLKTIGIITGIVLVANLLIVPLVKAAINSIWG